jgi:hypothetical protein
MPLLILPTSLTKRVSRFKGIREEGEGRGAKERRRERGEGREAERREKGREGRGGKGEETSNQQLC